MEMTIWQAMVLGAVQGATEFLPVSSSGHLVVGRELFGLAEIPVLFDVLLHVATLVAVIGVFHRRLWAFIVAIAHAIARRATATDRVYLRLIPLIIVTTVVTGVLGVGMDALFEIRAPRTTAFLFLVTAAILVATSRLHGSRGLDGIRWIDAVVLGVGQGMGVLPGISRSGITISTGLALGLDRATAGEFSFILSIPAILGALVLTLGDASSLGSQVGVSAIVAGCLAATAVGVVSLLLLLRVVRSGRLGYFAIYLVPLGIVGLIVL